MSWARVGGILQQVAQGDQRVALAAQTLDERGEVIDETRAGAGDSVGVVEIRNEGTDELAVTGLSFDGADAADFGLLVDSVTVAPGDTARIDVRFQPLGTGPKTATLRIASDDADEGSVGVTLAGRGVVPDVAVAPTAVDWGDVRVAAAASRAFELRNDGTSALAVSGATCRAELGLGVGQGELERAPLLHPGPFLIAQCRRQLPDPIGIVLLRLNRFRFPAPRHAPSMVHARPTSGQ